MLYKFKQSKSLLCKRFKFWKLPLLDSLQSIQEKGRRNYSSYFTCNQMQLTCKSFHQDLRSYKCRLLLEIISCPIWIICWSNNQNFSNEIHKHSQFKLKYLQYYSATLSSNNSEQTIDIIWYSRILLLCYLYFSANSKNVWHLHRPNNIYGNFSMIVRIIYSILNYFI